MPQSCFDHILCNIILSGQLLLSGQMANSRRWPLTRGLTVGACSILINITKSPAKSKRKAWVALTLLVFTLNIKSVIARLQQVRPFSRNQTMSGGPKDQKSRCPTSKQVISCLTAFFVFFFLSQRQSNLKYGQNFDFRNFANSAVVIPKIEIGDFFFSASVDVGLKRQEPTFAVSECCTMLQTNRALFFEHIKQRLKKCR